MVHQTPKLSKLIYRKRNNCLKVAQSRLYPYACFICDKLGHNGLDLCNACLQNLHSNQHSCLTCDIELASTNVTCARCLKTTPYFDKIISLYRYERHSAVLIQSLKFQAKHSAAKMMGTFMAAEFKFLETKPDALIAAPLHAKRLRARV
jgi:predicted amidophosphoribosyltransferase